MNVKSNYIALFALSSLLAISSLAVFAGASGSLVTAKSADSAGSNRASHIVTFEDDVDVDRLVLELETQYGAQSRFVYRHALKGASLLVPDRSLQDLSSHPGVKQVETNGGVELMAFPVEQEVQGWMERGGLGASHPFADINGDGVEIDVDIAIIDSGVAGSHPDINLYAAIECIFGRSGEDPSVPDGCTTLFDLSDLDATNDDPLASIDEAGHGTRVASIAGARDNGFGIVGMAPGARIWSARLSGDDTAFGGAASSDQPFIDSFIGAVDWVTANASEIEVINASVGFRIPSAAARTAVQGAVNAGIIFFAAAGNVSADLFGDDGVFGTPDDIEPASYPEIAAISGYVDTDGLPGGLGPVATDGEADDTFWVHPTLPGFGSNTSASAHPGNPVPVVSPGAAIDFAMPAKDIVSACLPTALIDTGTIKALCAAASDGEGGNYSRSSGTSFASPQAAGLAALFIARNGTRDFNNDTFVNAADTYVLRQALIDLAVAQNDADFGLVQPSGDPDGNHEPLGSARMVLNFDVTQLTLPDIGSSQTVTLQTVFIPLLAADSVQLNILHDETQFTVQNPQCGAAYAGGTPSGPTPNTGTTGTLVSCAPAPAGAFANGGNVLTFDLVRADNGGADITLDAGAAPEGTGFLEGGVLTPDTGLPALRVFGASITGSFDLEAVSGQTELTLIGPGAMAIPVTGSASLNAIGQYDPATGTFSVEVNAPGDYDVQASAGGFLPRRSSSSVTVVADESTVPYAPSTTLRAGDVDGDGDVDGGDLSIWLLSFGTEPPDRLDIGDQFVVDIDADLAVTGRDLSLLVSNIGHPSGGGVEDWLAT